MPQRAENAAADEAGALAWRAQGNLFSDWRTVIELAENLPKLRVLNFGCGRRATHGAA